MRTEAQNDELSVILAINYNKDSVVVSAPGGRVIISFGLSETFVDKKITVFGRVVLLCFTLYDDEKYLLLSLRLKEVRGEFLYFYAGEAVIPSHGFAYLPLR